ncbi:MAG TPA: protein TolQ [Polyangiaceae bacterium LLY-WYZ-14_1]|jgi:biopolymer transport protein TolQ|nr:protein TolQ [Polyangiaceae bacterium LLY-WYZ-14_1]
MSLGFVWLQAAAPASGEPLDPLALVLEASPVVKGVMILLVLMSVACWFIIGAKLVQLARAAGQSRRFLETFWRSEGASARWNAERLEGVYAHLSRFTGSPIAAVFKAGYVELARLAEEDPEGRRPTLDLDNVERALRRANTAETTAMEALLPVLATTGATAPFIGLFGTVWGIMNSFINIGAQQNASLDVVAPGIAEALIATAIGLVAAIPAVMAYNYFIRRLRIIESEMAAFSSDYLNIVRRYFLTD